MPHFGFGRKSETRTVIACQSTTTTPITISSFLLSISLSVSISRIPYKRVPSLEILSESVWIQSTECTLFSTAHRLLVAILFNSTLRWSLAVILSFNYDFFFSLSLSAYVDSNPTTNVPTVHAFHISNRSTNRRNWMDAVKLEKIFIKWNSELVICKTNYIYLYTIHATRGMGKERKRERENNCRKWRPNITIKVGNLFKVQMLYIVPTILPLAGSHSHIANDSRRQLRIHFFHCRIN